MASKPAPIFAIGDVHGCAPELHRLLTELPLTQDSTIVFLGDLIDRGNYSSEVISTIIDLKKKYKVIALMGNHEDMFIEFMNRSGSAEAASFILNGGSSTLASYADEEGKYVIPEEHVDFLRDLKLFYETDRHFFVHAGVPDVPLNEIKPAIHKPILLWTRRPFLNSTFNWGKTIVHGHSPVDAVEKKENRINLDTGCVFDGQLTAIEVNSGKFYSVEKNLKKEARIYLRDKTSSRVATRFFGQIDVTVQESSRTSRRYVTENYSEFGLLLKDIDFPGQASLQMHQIIQGIIGNQEHRKIHFEGEVVRIENRGTEFLYGIKIVKAWAGDENPRKGP